MKKEDNKKIIIFQEDEKALNYMYRITDLLNNDIAVKSIDYDVNDFRKKFNLIGGEPTINSVYYLHPYKKNTYVHESIDENYYLREKLGLYKSFGQKLGAKSIQTIIKSVESKKIEIDADGKFKVKVIEGGATFKSKIEEKYMNSLEIKEEYQLQENFNIDKNIKDLKLFIEENNLNYELELRELIDARDSKETGTILTKRSVKSEISSEYNKLLEISAHVVNPVFNTNANFKRKFEKINTLNIEIIYEF